MKRPRLIRFGHIAAAVFIGSAILLSLTASHAQARIQSSRQHPHHRSVQ